MSESILVTGGTGVLGRQLVRRLLKSGAEVTILCRNPRQDLFPGHDNFPGYGNLRRQPGDISSPNLGLAPESWDKLVLRTTAVFHLAARTDFKSSSLADYRPVNVNGVSNVYSLAAGAGAPMHHVSTAFVCGIFPGTFTETMLDQGQEFRNFYEQSKFQGELFLRAKQQQGVIPITIYRPGIILERHPTSASDCNFGPFTFLDAIFRLLVAAKRHNCNPGLVRVIGNRESRMPFVFDDEVAEVLVALSQRRENQGKTFHLTPPTGCANQEIETLFNRAFGRRVVRWAGPEEIDTDPLRPEEELLARRTRMYKDYLNLATLFDRTELNTALGLEALADLEADEVLQSFSRFLACKQGVPSDTPRATTTAHAIRSYFNEYLPGFFGRPMLKNLVSLNAMFCLKIKEIGTWRIHIDQGCLRTVSPGTGGSFSYTVPAETFLAVVRGERSPQEGFFQGEIAISGNTKKGLRTATALEEFFSRFPYPQESRSCRQ